MTSSIPDRARVQAIPVGDRSVSAGHSRESTHGAASCHRTSEPHLKTRGIRPLRRRFPFAFGNSREAQAERERLQEAIQRHLCRIVAQVDGSQHVRTGHVHRLCELLHSHGANHLGQRRLNGHAVFNRREQEFRANSLLVRSAASPTFQSLLRLAMSLHLQEIAPQAASSAHISAL